MKTNSQNILKRFFLSRLFLIGIFLIATITAVSYARAYYQDYTVRLEIRRLEKEVEALQKKKFASLELLQYTESQNFLEERARTELNLKKQGEEVLVIPGISPVGNEEDTAQWDSTVKPGLDDSGKFAVNNNPLRNPVKWWYYFTRQQLPR